MQLTLWTYEGPPHVGAMRVATAMRDVHYVLHAPQGDTYADLLFTMIERRAQRPPVTYTTFEARDLGGDTATLFKDHLRTAYDCFQPKLMLVGASCTAELLQDEQMRLMPNPRPFDGYIEQPLRVSATALIHFQRNRYSVPTTHAHRVVSLRIYPAELVVVANGAVVARHERSFERHQTHYDFTHYIDLIERKPGALRNGAPFAQMPEPLIGLQRHLLKHPGGDRVMAQVLAAIPVHGLDAVLVAVELALESGRPSGEHVLNVLARLKDAAAPVPAIATPLALTEEPAANVDRYDGLRQQSEAEADHVG